MTEQLSSIQTEYALIGTILADNRAMDHFTFLMPEHFHSGPHAEIYEAMLTLHAKGEPITPFTIKVNRDYEEQGGLARYLGASINSSLAVIDPVKQARYLVRLAQKRAFVAVCTEAAKTAEVDDKTADEHAVRLQAELESICRGYGTPDFLNDSQVTQQILDGLRDRRKPYSTGLFRLDEAMGGGLYPGKSYGFAAKKKVGKTILASTISCNLNVQGVKHLFICAEMSPQEIQERNLSRLMDKGPACFRLDHGKTADFQKAVTAQQQASNKCILYHNAPGLTFLELKRVCSSAVLRQGVKGIILDYWQLVGGKDRQKSPVEHLDEVAQWLADFGRKHAVWVISMAQINQEGNTRGGEGIRLAFDQVYSIRGTNNPSNVEDISLPRRWLEMMDTRYTAWLNVGGPDSAGLYLHGNGPYFSHDESW